VLGIGRSSETGQRSSLLEVREGTVGRTCEGTNEK